MRVLLAYLSLSLSIGLAAALSPAQGHEGHSHDEPVRTASPVAPRGEAASGDMQLLAVLRQDTVVVYLDQLSTNAPITDAAIEALTPGGSQQAEAQADGTYRLASPWVDGRDHYDLIFTVTRGEASEVFAVTIVGPAAASESAAVRQVPILQAALIALMAAFTAFVLGVFAARIFSRRRTNTQAAAAALVLLVAVASLAQAHEGHEHQSPRPAATDRDVLQRLADGTIFMPKAVQRLLEIRTRVLKEGEHSRAIELPGRVIPDANASGYVQSTLAGRLLPPPGGFPALGSRVEKGQVLAYVEPPIQAIDASDMRQKEGELLQQIAIIERRVARFEKLVESNAVPRTQLEDARIELEGLRDRQAQLDKIRREPEVLLAPASGIIAEANTVAGQLAQPSTIIFRIIDPTRLWVEALSFDALPAVERASARTHDGNSVELTFRGSAAALRNQSIATHFAVNGATQSIWAGQFVTVFASLPDKRRGLLVPRAAVVRSANGQQVVFEHVSAERFMPREVKIDPLDADNVLVTGGLTQGARIVVQGAELLEQVR